MKKYSLLKMVSLLLVACMIFTLGACGELPADTTATTAPTTEPSTAPVEPAEPTVPATEPSTAPVEPAEPTVPATEPSTEPIEPTEPSVPATEPSAEPVEPTEPTAPATEPSTEPIEPTEPSVPATEPSTEPAEPTVPTVPATEPNNEYNISTAADIQKLFNACGTYTLTNDIDLMGATLEPIDGFSGVLEGNGYAIKNFSITGDEDNLGFFSVLSGSVKNLRLENVTLETDKRLENVGILCGQLCGSATDVYVSGNINAPRCNYVGGIAGHMDVNTVDGLKNDANITGADYVGGIFGCAVTHEFQLADALNNGKITGKSYVGGIVGYNYTYDDVEYTALHNGGNIEASGEYVGGICGNVTATYYYETLTVTDCSNTGSVVGKNYVGGLFGYAETEGDASIITNCTSAAKISGKAYVGGLVGYIEDISVVDCRNAGSILAEKGEYVGGIAGYADYPFDSAMYDLENTANITGADYVGGILGCVVTHEFQLSDTWNNGKINGESYVGGIVGQHYSYGDVEYTALSNSGDIEASGEYVGGICGDLTATCYSGLTLTTTDCINTGPITGKAYVGGLFGHAETIDDTSTIAGCTSAAEISGEAYVGGLVGYLKDISVMDCSNAGSILAGKGGYAGGIAGYADCDFDGAMYDLENNANITGTDYVGGIFGYVKTDEFQFSDIRNNGNIAGKSYVGGIIGRHSSYDDVEYTALSNGGDIEASGDYVGGLCGNLTATHYYETLTTADCINTGSITGKAYVGGLFGYAETEGDTSTITNSASSGTVNGTDYVGEIAGELVNITIQ